MLETEIIVENKKNLNIHKKFLFDNLNVNWNINKDIYITNLFDTDANNKYINMDYKKNLFMALIPKKSKCFISTIRHGTTMDNLFDKISDFGLAFQGFFNIQPITTLPSLCQTKCNSKSTEEIAFVVIDNHTNLKIMNYNNILSYQPIGVNVQYIEGIKLYENGISFMNSIYFNCMDFASENNGQKSFLKIFCQHLLLAIDYNDNIYVIYHPNTNFTNIDNLLEDINCKDAVLLCNSGTSNIMWKYANQPKRNNFIGDQNETISDIIIFSA